MRGQIQAVWAKGNPASSSNDRLTRVGKAPKWRSDKLGFYRDQSQHILFCALGFYVTISAQGEIEGAFHSQRAGEKVRIRIKVMLDKAYAVAICDGCNKAAAKEVIWDRKTDTVEIRDVSLESAAKLFGVDVIDRLRGDDPHRPQTENDPISFS